jgi:hypothetical protein
MQTGNSTNHRKCENKVKVVEHQIIWILKKDIKNILKITIMKYV